MTLLLVQMAVLLTAVLCGSIGRKLGQGRVIGEIVAGILVGPSVFGLILFLFLIASLSFVLFLGISKIEVPGTVTSPSILQFEELPEI